MAAMNAMEVYGMANQQQLELLRQGVDIWNKWRQDHADMRPDLSNADLSQAILTEIDFHDTDMYRTILKSAELTGAKFSGVNLTEADLSNANLYAANFFLQYKTNKGILSRAEGKQALLRGTNFSRAALVAANFTHADLKEANLSETRLERTNLNGADLSGADFTGAATSHSVFVNVDLRSAKGLNNIVHVGPSRIDIDTIIRSQGEIPEVFLREAGVPENFITYVRSLINNPIEYYTCFISYSSKDQAFAERLHADLVGKKVRCWFAPEDLKIGDKFWHRIDESIRIYDKLLVVLSEDSVQSAWVENEVMTALEKEQQQSKLVLFPIKLDEAVMQTNQPWAASLRRSRHIGDFTHWKNHDDYQWAFNRLLRDLQAET
jgi:TIR domain/Pentapeptide repeats (8 copies)